jgi:hypothetical protein
MAAIALKSLLVIRALRQSLGKILGLALFFWQQSQRVAVWVLQVVGWGGGIYFEDETGAG